MREPRAISGASFDVALERFEGPLDLLLHLIRAQQLDIFDIPIAMLTRQFLDALSRISAADLPRAGEFLETAATLVRIKAHMLFPARDDESGADDPRVDLVRRLLEYEQLRDAARTLAGAERARARRYARGAAEPRPVRAIADAPLVTTWADVASAAAELRARREPAKHAGYTFSAPPVRVEEKLALVTHALASSARIEFVALVRPWGTRGHAAATVLACLELARRNLVRLRQAAPFASLWVYGDASGARR